MTFSNIVAPAQADHDLSPRSAIWMQFKCSSSFIPLECQISCELNVKARDLEPFRHIRQHHVTPPTLLGIVETEI